MYRIIGADQKEYGPVSADDLRRWIAEGRANANTLAWTPGMTEWRALGLLPEFSRLFPPVSAATSTASQPSGTSGMAITGLIFSLLGIPCCWTLVFPFLGLIFSTIGIAQTGRDSNRSGRTIAVVGFVISLVTLFFTGLLWIVAALGAIKDGGGRTFDL